MADDTPDYPGKKFGLPKDGPMSVAPMGRRLIALIVDWVLCYLIASSIVRHNVFTVTDAHYQQAQLVALLLFAFEIYLLTAVSGLTVGKRLLGLRTIRTDGSRPGFKWAALRTILLICVIPPCLSDRDLRGLHDRAADTIVVRL
ncbi:MAG TPA: RDD family protein [Trebonia sp.]